MCVLGHVEHALRELHIDDRRREGEMSAVEYALTALAAGAVVVLAVAARRI